MLDLFKKFKKRACQNQAYSLIELIVALSIFVIVIVMTMAIFSSILKAQRKSYNLQLTQDTARYVIEMMAKEARMAKVNSITTSGTSCVLNMQRLDNADNIIYTFFNDAAGSVGQVQRNNPGAIPLPMSRIINDSNKVEIKGCFYGTPANKRITVVLEAQSQGSRPGEQAVIQLQTSVNSRYYGS